MELLFRLVCGGCGAVVVVIMAVVTVESWVKGRRYR